jgi:hypothetical protein
MVTIDRKCIASLVNGVSGTLIGKLMRGGVLYDRRNFERWARDGFYVVSRTHFYHPLPDIYEVRDRAKVPVADPMEGISLHESQQLELVRLFAREYAEEYHRLSNGLDSTYDFRNGTFESLDAVIYWGMLRHFAPKAIVEIGSGNSTRLALIYLDDHPNTSLTVVDPYPSEELTELLAGRLVVERLEQMSSAPFDTLGPGDVLFVDGSHVVKSGGDVNRALLQIVPRLAPGVLVHVHDIYLPYDYTEGVYDQGMFWTEQYLLQAYLCDNPHVEILAMSHLLATRYQHELRQLFPMLSGVWGASFWFRKL